MHHSTNKRMRRLAILAAAGLVLSGVRNLTAQDKTFQPENYYDYLPGTQPKRQTIVTETAASSALHLYGDVADPMYRDEDLNGIDDKRQERLLAIAEMFSPVLRRNNFSVPRDFRKMLRLQFDRDTGHIDFARHERLHVDTWDVAGPRSTNRHEAVVDVDCIRSRQSGVPDPVCQDNCDECLLESVLEHNNPLRPSRRFFRPDSATDTVLYYNFPGVDERSWKRIYTKLAEMERVDGGFDTHIFAHFLIQEQPESEGDAKYRLAIQYWFFYPFNDGGNNHEGDWEHINVHITNDDVRDAWMTQQEIAAILDGSQDLPHLVIKEVDYYFHHFVLTLDFIDGVFDFYRRSIGEIRTLLDGMPQRENIRRWKIYRLMHDRLRLLEGCGIRWNRHPIGLIGANSRGPELLLRLPEQSNRNSHGTYPFSGIWKQVGPLGATEELDEDQAKAFRKRTEYKFVLPEPERTAVGEGWCETPAGDLLESEFESTPNEQYLTFTRNDITLLPDWERLLPLVEQHPVVRTEWYWFMLPIRWGFPAVTSPGAGLIKDADLGNVSPVGPAYNTAWNRLGEARGYHAYDAHHLPAIWQIEVTDNFANKLGFLNAAVLSLYLPGLNALPFLWRAYRPRRKFTQTRPPSSFIDVQAGFGIHHLDQDFARYVSDDLNWASTGTFAETGERYWVRASTRLNRFESAVGYEWLKGAAISTSTSSDAAGFRMHELYGDLTLRLTGSAIAPFVLGGYGYRRVFYEGDFGLRSHGWDCDVRSNAKHWVPDIASCFVPNAWHIGGGLDWMFYKNDNYAFLWNWHVPDIGIRLAYRATFQRLPNDDWGTRHDFNGGVILGF